MNGRWVVMLLAAGVLLFGSACRRREPHRIDRNLSTETVTYEADTASRNDELLPVDDPRRLAAASKWDGNMQMVTSDEQIYIFSHGLGTKNEPYLLKDALDVARFAANVRYRGTPGTPYQDLTQYEGMHFRLECDIDMQGKPWFGIGGNGATWEDSTMFAGTFDGNGHVIYNFALADTPMNGFFSYVGRGGTVKNLTIASGNVRARSGEVMGVLIAGVRYGGTVENCAVRVNLIAPEGTVPQVGAVGVIETQGRDKWNVTFRNCDFSGSRLNGYAFELPDFAKKT